MSKRSVWKYKKIKKNVSKNRRIVKKCPEIEKNRLKPGLNKVFKDFIQILFPLKITQDVQSALDVLREVNPLTKIAGTKQEIKEYLQKAYGSDKSAVSITSLQI